MPITIDPSISEELSGVLPTPKEIRLPFPHAVLQWNHGKPELSDIGGVRHFGGWDVDITAGEEAIEAYGDITGWKREPRRSGTSGEDYEVFSNRHATIAPIATRLAYFNPKEKGKLYPKMEPGTRSRFQLLALLGVTDGDVVKPWGPVIVTVKSSQTPVFKGLLKLWEGITEPARKKWAQGVPANLFWLVVGTFGPKRIEDRTTYKDDDSKVASIAPIQLYQPAGEIDEAKLTKIFVGEDTARYMLQLKRDAEEWINAWSPERLNELNEAFDKEQAEQEEDVVSVTGEIRDEFKSYFNQPVPEEEIEELDIPMVANTTPAVDLSGAKAVTVPVGFFKEGETFGALAGDGVGVKVLKYFAGQGTARGGGKFDPASVPNGTELQNAAQVILENL